MDSSACITQDHKQAIDELKEKRNTLQTDEIGLKRACNDVPYFLIKHVNVYGVMVISAAFIGVSLGLGVKYTFSFLGTIAFLYFIEMAVVSLLVFKKLKRMFSRISLVERRRGDLRDALINLKGALPGTAVDLIPTYTNPKLSVAENQVNEMIKSLESGTGYFKEDYYVLRLTSSIIYTLLPITIIGWLIYLHHFGGDKFASTQPSAYY